MTVLVRAAGLADLETIVDFNLALADETEGKSLDRTLLTEGVRRGLQDATPANYFVAEVDGQVVGQIMYTHEWSDWRNGDLLWLQSVYVAQDFRRRGVFGLLLNAVREIARANPDVIGIRLYVEQQNATAQATYVRHGFCRPGYIVMQDLMDSPAGDSA